MGNSPYDFILNHSELHLKQMDVFVHRTFNSVDLLIFIEGLKRLYKQKNGLEGIFVKYQTNDFQYRRNTQYHSHIPGLRLILVMNVVISDGQDSTIIKQGQHHDHYRSQRIKVKEQDG
jgi:hypothetical protein